MTRKNPPLIRFNPLGQRIYVLTRYTVKETHILAHEKFDVTDEVLVAVTEFNLAQENEARSGHDEG